MAKRLVDRHKGDGQLETTPGKLTSVTYDIGEYCTVLSAASNDDPNATLDGLRSTRGVIRTRDGSMLPFGTIVTLHLKDGRKLRVIPESPAASSEVQGTGGFF